MTDTLESLRAEVAQLRVRLSNADSELLNAKRSARVLSENLDQCIASMRRAAGLPDGESSTDSSLFGHLSPLPTSFSSSGSRD